MKYRLLALLLAALLLAGCQDRSGPAPSSSSEVESAGSASGAPHPFGRQRWMRTSLQPFPLAAIGKPFPPLASQPRPAGGSL